MLRRYSVDPDPAMIAKIVYFAHDLSDPAVHRRVRMLVAGGAAVTLIGFRRSAEAPNAVEGLRPIDLGQTADGMLVRRMLSVVGALVRLGGMAEHIRHANVILARNLEMLVPAIRARKRYAPQATVAYECLDIHRMLLSNSLHGRLFRLLESKLWRDVDLLLTSSPAFIRHYFAPRGFPSPIRLVENKVLMIGERETGTPSVRPPPGPPWRIGWFGMIRCRKSFDILSSFARAAGGAVEIIIRGRVSGATFRDFDAAIADLPNVQFAGPYRNPADLPSIYGNVHFNWAIDYYESGRNSAWLLPNRVYEGSLYGAVPIGLAGVETGHWLAKRGAGVVLDEPIERQLADFFRRLDRDSYAILAQGVEALPRPDLISNKSDCRELVDALCRSSAAHAWAFPARASLFGQSQTALERDGMKLRSHESSQSSTGPVLVVIPCLNEEQHIERVVTKLAIEADLINLKIVVADGGSTDRTRAIVARMAETNHRIVLMDNPKRIQSAAVNHAVRRYGGGARFLVRVDAHADYPDRYCTRLLKVQTRTRADSVVVSMHTEGHTCFERAAAAAQNSILGNGGAAHRNETEGRWVDHGHHALMTLNAFRAVGGYDETFTHNEDAELDARLTAEGFHIYLTGEAKVTYYPRGSAAALFWQYFNIGRGRARNFLKHHKNTKLRHLVLAAVAPAVCLLLLVPFSGIFAFPAPAWALGCLGYGLVLGVRQRDACAAAAGIAAIAMQAGWSFGFFAGLKARLSENGRKIMPGAEQKATTNDGISR